MLPKLTPFANSPLPSPPQFARVAFHIETAERQAETLQTLAEKLATEVLSWGDIPSPLPSNDPQKLVEMKKMADLATQPPKQTGITPLEAAALKTFEPEQVDMGALPTAESMALALKNKKSAQVDEKSPASAKSELEIIAETYELNQKYEVIKKLGQGGMGDVYLVKHKGTGGLVAIKTLKMKILQGSDAEHIAKGFQQEARIGTFLKNTKAVTIHDFHLTSGGPYIVMDYVPGKDLDDLLKEGTDWGELRIIFTKILLAMANVHKAGVVHKDLKPQNIRLNINENTQKGEEDVYLLDLGIAEVFQKIGTEEPKAPKFISGTGGYNAPEIVRRPTPLPSAREDVFSLGVILYQIICGKLPFAEPQDQAAPKKKVPNTLLTTSRYRGGKSVPFEPLKEHKISDSLKAEFQRIFNKATHFDPLKRYPTAEEFSQDFMTAIFFKMNIDFVDLYQNTYMAQAYADMLSLWDKVDWAKFEDSGTYTPLLRSVQRQNSMRTQWMLTTKNLVRNIEEAMTKYGTWDAAKQLIAELTWKRLVEEGNRIEPITREELKSSILEYDTSGKLKQALDPLTGKTKFSYTAKNQNLTHDKVSVRLTPWIPEIDEGEQFETPNYDMRRVKHVYKGETSLTKEEMEAECPLTEEEMKSGLQPGYYLATISSPGYKEMNIPITITLEDVRNHVEKNQPYHLAFTLESSEKVPHGMQVIHEGEAHLGQDIRDGNPRDDYSRPLYKKNIPTFLMTETPVTVGEYSNFVESLILELNAGLTTLDEVKKYIPRNAKGEYWTIDTYQQGDETKYKLIKACSKEVEKSKKEGRLPLSLDPGDDPIFDEQPVTSITYEIAQKYTQWWFVTKGLQASEFEVDLPTAEEMEKVQRSGLDWKYPNGNEFNAAHYGTSLHHGDVKKAYLQAVGTHSDENYKDVSLYGIREIIGQARKFTSTTSGPMVFLKGGSIRTMDGVLFNPASISYVNKTTPLECYGSFFIVLRPKKKPE